VNEREVVGLSAGGVRKFVALLIHSREFEGKVIIVIDKYKRGGFNRI
jgi:hypothetical protein